MEDFVSTAPLYRVVLEVRLFGKDGPRPRCGGRAACQPSTGLVGMVVAACQGAVTLRRRRLWKGWTTPALRRDPGSTCSRMALKSSSAAAVWDVYQADISSCPSRRLVHLNHAHDDCSVAGGVAALEPTSCAFCKEGFLDADVAPWPAKFLAVALEPSAASRT